MAADGERLSHCSITGNPGAGATNSRVRTLVMERMEEPGPPLLEEAVGIEAAHETGKPNP